MTRSFHQFICAGDRLTATLDEGGHSVGLLIVSGGNEIRSGAHAGMARLAHVISSQDFPVFRYDRRGIGESGGVNNEFMSSQADIVAAAEYFHTACPSIQKILAFGNCDAATALAMFGDAAGIDTLILANPWVIETARLDISASNNPTAPPPSAIRAHYWERLKNPRTMIDLFKGQIDVRKFITGLKQATQKKRNTELSLQLRDALLHGNSPCKILLAKRDTTARAFLAAWNSADYSPLRNCDNIELTTLDSASHSFADEKSKNWLENQILEALQSA